MHTKFEAAKRSSRAYKYDSFLSPFLFATSSAIIGSMCVVMSKCMAQLVQVFVNEGIKANISYADPSAQTRPKLLSRMRSFSR